MRMLVKNISRWHPISLAVWDWRVLEILDEIRDEMDDERCKPAVKEHFIASMRWIEEHEGQGAVEIHWRDGKAEKMMDE